MEGKGGFMHSLSELRSQLNALGGEVSDLKADLERKMIAVEEASQALREVRSWQCRRDEKSAKEVAGRALGKAASTVYDPYDEVKVVMEHREKDVRASREALGQRENALALLERRYKVAHEKRALPSTSSPLASVETSWFRTMPRDVFLHFLEYLPPSERMDLYDTYGRDLFRSSRLEELDLAYGLVANLLKYNGTCHFQEDTPSNAYQDIWDERQYFRCRRGSPKRQLLRSSETDPMAIISKAVVQHPDLMELLEILYLGGFGCHAYEGVEDEQLVKETEAGYSMGGGRSTFSGVTLVASLPEPLVINACVSGGMVEYRGLY